MAKKIALFFPFFLFFSTFGWPGSPLSAYGDTLEELNDSAILQNMEERSQRDKIDLKRYSKDLPRDKDFSKLFVKFGGAKLINFWLGVNNPEYPLRDDSNCRKTPTSVRCDVQYILPNNERIYVEVIVPNPNYTMLAEFRFVEEITKLEPPILVVKSSKKVEIAGHQGTFYETPEGICSYLFHLNQKSVINFKSKCENDKEMREIIETLNITRLNTRLLR